MQNTTSVTQIVLALSWKLNAQFVPFARAFLCPECVTQAGLDDDQVTVLVSPAGDGVTAIHSHNKGYDECIPCTCPGCGRNIDGGDEIIFAIR